MTPRSPAVTHSIAYVHLKAEPSTLARRGASLRQEHRWRGKTARR